MRRSSRSIRNQVLSAASLIGLMAAQQAFAQEAAPTGLDQAASSRNEADIVVTGSRIAGTKITAARRTSPLIICW